MQKFKFPIIIAVVGAISLCSCGSKGSQQLAGSDSSRICFLDTFQRMGVVTRDNPTGTADFRFVNTGSTAMVILDVKPSCTCTTVEYTHDPVMPGDTSVIRAIYHGEGREPEFFSKEVIVYTSASSKDFILSFEGELR